MHTLPGIANRHQQLTIQEVVVIENGRGLTFFTRARAVPFQTSP